jgi:maltooligosyltrehalose trehalohydrolase
VKRASGKEMTSRRLAVGAELQPGGGVDFRVWAPRRRRVEMVTGTQSHELRAEPDGYFSGTVPGLGAGALYRYRLDGGDAFPDPASRFQPEGPHGPSQVVDPAAFRWSDAGWRGLPIAGQVIYEMHVGTFTHEGTFAAAARELPELAAAGISVIEVMPIAEFSGRFGWGYDGVNLYAPTRLYGEPDDLRRFVDRAHACGVAVILDVVYNHLGPDGNYLKEYSPHYFTDRYENEWGEPINFDGDGCEPVREYFGGNAGYWIDEFHMDGLRLDATQQIFDESGHHVLEDVTRNVRQAARGRDTIVVAENEPQDARLVRPVAEGGMGMDALWNDDYHHSAMVALTGRNEAYYTDYHGTPQEFISALKRGFLYQGQRYLWQKEPRGTNSLGLPPTAFVMFLQNHDQVANSSCGWRIDRMSSPGVLRAMTALTLLAPGTPMLFQGQEFASSAPFHFFADHEPGLAARVRKGRSEFMKQFRSLATREARECLPDPADPATFERCKLDLAERERHAEAYALHRDLLQLRRDDAAFRVQRAGAMDGAVLAEHAFVLRYFAAEGDRLVLVNLGRDLHLAPAPEPLLAPPDGKRWRILWSSEDLRYGGTGAAEPDTDEGLRIPGHCALVLEAR